MKSDKLKIGMILDASRYSIGSSEIIIITDIKNDVVEFDRFFGNDFLKGPHWMKHSVLIKRWNDGNGYMWSRLPATNGREAIMKYFKNLDKNE